MTNKFLTKNFNKIVIYKYRLGRLVGGFYSDLGFHHVIINERGVFQETLHENHIYILKKDDSKLLIPSSLLPCFDQPIIKDFRGQLLYSKDKSAMIKAKANLLFNKIITSNGNIYRIVGFAIHEDGYFLITYDLSGKKGYLEIISHYEEDLLNNECLNSLNNIISKEEYLLEEYIID